MISNYLFAVMAADSVNSTAAAVLSDVRLRMDLPDLAEADLPPYTYTSLKTLLKETSNSLIDGKPAWAVNRILDVKSVKKFVQIPESDQLPIIQIAVSDIGPDKTASKTIQSPHRLSAMVEILVHTNPTVANSLESFNIMQRINSLLVTHTPSGMRQAKDLVQTVSGIKGLANLTIDWRATPISSWDVQKSVYKAHATLIS